MRREPINGWKVVLFFEASIWAAIGFIILPLLCAAAASNSPKTADGYIVFEGTYMTPDVFFISFWLGLGFWWTLIMGVIGFVTLMGWFAFGKRRPPT